MNYNSFVYSKYHQFYALTSITLEDVNIESILMHVIKLVLCDINILTILLSNIASSIF